MDLLQQLRLCPAELLCRPNVPDSFFEALTALQNGRVLRPADGHGLCHDLRCVRIRPPEVTHPTEISGGEALGVRMGFAKILGGGNSRPFFRPGTDELADFIVQFHLRQSGSHQCIQGVEHGAVIYGFPNVHELLLSSVNRYYFR